LAQERILPQQPWSRAFRTDSSQASWFRLSVQVVSRVVKYLPGDRAGLFPEVEAALLLQVVEDADVGSGR
jgi:hypothetical protein